MSSKTLLKILSCVMIVSMMLAMAGSSSPAIAKPNSPKPAVPALTEIGTPASDQEIAAIKARADGSANVMLEMTAQPTTVVYAQAFQTNGIIVTASSSATAAFSQIQQAQKQLVSALDAMQTGATVLYQVHAAYDGVAVRVPKNKLNALKTLPGLKAIHALIAKSPDNAESVPFINAPFVWQLGLSGNTGAGVKVGVIDTGIDYLHTDFGGSGTGYDTIDFTKVGGPGDPYPTAKVAGGWDFAGDAYNAEDTSPVIAPDPNPMDCAGHGSHVSGTIAGYGVNGDGTTYTGSYGEGTNFSGMRIGPGVAPKATLYALRVFGCAGSTDLVTEAIDWAVDPNHDGDPSDHLDVINMSLGSSFGSAYDTDAIASDNAAAVGVIVVASAGNAYDTHYIAGSPADSTRAISVAASVDPGDTWDSFQVTAPVSISGLYASSNSVAYDWLANPDVTGDLVYPDSNRGGCLAFPAGTFTGKVALLDWTHTAPGVNECGSVTRTQNARLAGAIGVILAYDLPTLDISITGDAIIPSTITFLATGNILKQHLAVPETVTVRFSKQYIGGVTIVDPTQADTLASFSSRGSRRYDNFLKPDISAPGMTIFSARALSGNLGESLNGTSMASPHVAGVMALLRQLHPTWSVEELKALVMNTAGHDLTTQASGAGSKYTPARIGAGRVDVKEASQSLVVAYNAEDVGAVSLSFGLADVPVDQTAFVSTKNFKLENKGGILSGPVTYNVAYSAAPSWSSVGVGFSVVDHLGNPVTSVTVDPGNSVDLAVKLTVNGTLLKHNLDASMTASQNGGGRSYMNESGGYITFAPTAGSDQSLRLPVYAVTRPVASMHSNTNIPLQLVSGDTELQLSGTGINTGNSTPTDIISQVTALELKYAGKDKHLSPEAASGNIQYAGVMSDISGEDNLIANTWLFFGVSTFGKWSTASAGDTEFDISIDTTGDGNPDFVVWNTSLKDSAGDASDAFVSVVYNLNTGVSYTQTYLNGVPGSVLDTNPYNNNVMVIPVKASRLGLTDASASIHFWIDSFTREAGPNPVDSIGGTDGIPYNAKNLAIDTSGGFAGSPIYNDLPGEELPLTFNKANAGPEGVMGVLLLHHHNGSGNTAQVVNLLQYSTLLPVVFGNNP